MDRVKSLDDLKKIRERLRGNLNIRESSNHPETLPRIRVSMGTCGIAAGAKEVMARFVELLRKSEVDAVVTQAGCMGYCNAEPTVEITLPGQEPVVYGDVTPGRVDDLVEKYIRCGELVDGIIPQQHNTLL